MNTIIRNFMMTLKRFKLATALNILGLSVAFAAFMVIMMQVYRERNFDRFHPKSGRIFRVEASSDSVLYTGTFSHPLIDLWSHSTPEFECDAMTCIPPTEYSPYGTYLTTIHNGIKKGYEEANGEISLDFLEIFDFELIEGTKENLREPGRLLLPQSAAERIFGDESAIDKQITWSQGNAPVMTVAAVFRDFPENTLVSNRIYAIIDPDVHGESYNWGWNTYQYYVALPPGADPQAVSQKLLDIHNKERGHESSFAQVRLNPVEDIYYSRDIVWDITPRGSRATNNILLSIAMLIIVVAGINYVNFATSLMPMRLKGFNTRKVLGSSDVAIRLSLIAEAAGILLVSFVLATLWVYLFGMSGISLYVPFDISVSGNAGIIAFSSIIALILGIVAGIYSAFYSTSFPPALVLKGSFGLSPKGQRLRTILVGFQFVVSIGLIVASVCMQLQNRYVTAMDKGVDTRRLLVTKLPAGIETKDRAILKDFLLSSPDVGQVSFSGDLFGISDRITNIGLGGNTPDGKNLITDIIYGSWDLPQLLGLRLTEGEFFTEQDEAEKAPKIIFNEAARKQMELELGSLAGVYTVSGFVEDFNYRPLRQGIEPVAFIMNLPMFSMSANMMYVRYEGDPEKTIGHIRKAIAEIDPYCPADVRFYSEFERQAYLKERRTTAVITTFSLLAVVISLVGVFGLVLFETQYRRKEIGVRKVFGATITEVLVMFGRSFAAIVAVCFLIAAPIAYIGIKNWLGAFAYRTPIHWWIFALAFLAVILVTLLTVTVQSWRAATANPVKSLKHE